MAHMIARYYEAAASLQFPRVRFGIGGLTLFPHDQVEEEQIGYSGPDWKKSWLVVAREEACGDPIFVDTADSELPVLTAMHGEGVWEPNVVAPSLRKFSEALVFVQPFCRNRQHPVGLAANPISAAERAKLFFGLRSILGIQVPSFWEALFESAT